MAHTRSWEETAPAGTEEVSLGDDRIRNLKVDLGERLEDLFYGFNISTVTGDEATVGVKKLNFKEQSSIATPSANQITIAAKEAGGKAELFFKDEDGDERQWTTGGALRVIAGDYAADSIDQDDIQLANNAPLKAANKAGDGEVNLIWADATDVSVVRDGTETASDAAPVGDKSIANMKYVLATPHTGGIVQIVNTQDGAVDTGTTVMPGNDTIPQITEGDEYMTLAITPNSATNKLKIEVVVNADHSVAATIIAALFQDTTADALAVSFLYNGGGQAVNIKFTHYMAAGTTSSTTFRVRVGGSAGGTTTFNGLSSGRYFGGKMASSITITEIKV